MSAHGPLARTNTAPVWGTSRSNGPGLTQTMSHTSNSRSSQLSGTTAAYSNSSSTSISSMTSSATLVAPTNSGPVQATNNIINQRADASRSLYQICVNLRQRLAQVPGFDTHLSDSDDEDDGEDMDPVSSLWRCLRKGVPLITIYNALQPADPLQVDERMPEAKKPKAAAFKFVAACMKDLNLPPGECFALSDLFGDDTTGFVKVCPCLNDSRPLLFTKSLNDSLSRSKPMWKPR
jgi:cell division control protein 24